jgi:hypothetical protein
VEPNVELSSMKFACSSTHPRTPRLSRRRSHLHRCCARSRSRLITVQKPLDEWPAMDRSAGRRDLAWRASLFHLTQGRIRMIGLSWGRFRQWAWLLKTYARKFEPLNDGLRTLSPIGFGFLTRKFPIAR